MVGFNKQAIIARIEAAESAGLEKTAAAVASEAKRRAPIRKVFKEPAGHRRRFRPLTPLERNIATRRAQAHYGSRSHAARVAVASIRARSAPGGHGAELRTTGSNNALSRSRSLRRLGTESGGKFTPHIAGASAQGSGYHPGALGSLLTARGRYEVRSGRAIHKTASGQVQIGGALKASIHAEGVISQASGLAVRVVAGIRYAKFVEFPTRHNAAQPFMRPALQSQRGNLARNISGELNRSLGG